MISAFRLGPAASGRGPFDIDSYTSRYETSNPPCDFNIKLILFHFLYTVVRTTCVRKKLCNRLDGLLSEFGPICSSRDISLNSIISLP